MALSLIYPVITRRAARAVHRISSAVGDRRVGKRTPDNFRATSGLRSRAEPHIIDVEHSGAALGLNAELQDRGVGHAEGGQRNFVAAPLADDERRSVSTDVRDGAIRDITRG